jgi:hypothetical protein
VSTPNDSAKGINDTAINNEQKFLDSLFKSALGIDYSKENLIKLVYGDAKKETVTVFDMTKLVAKLRHMQDQSNRIINFSEKTLKEELGHYKRAFDTQIALATEKLNKANSSQDHDAATQAGKEIMTMKRKLSFVVKSFNYLIKITNDFIVTHGSITESLLSKTEQIANAEYTKIVEKGKNL